MQLTALLYFLLPSAGSHVGGNVDILIDGFVSPVTSIAPMFPFFENTADWDDFGEVINPDDYMMKQDEMDNNMMLVSSLMCLLFLLATQEALIVKWKTQETSLPSSGVLFFFIYLRGNSLI